MASDTWLSKWESLQQLCGLCHDHSFHIPMELFVFLRESRATRLLSSMLRVLSAWLHSVVMVAP